MITGGAGFIGSAVVRHLLNETKHEVVVVDKLTYAGNLDSLQTVCELPGYKFFKIDICDRLSIDKVLQLCQPDVVMHLAAESHVDRSITGPGDFIETNIVGSYKLLDASLQYYRSLDGEKKRDFRFHHVSTDEVYGDLVAGTQELFTETTSYAPSSPYSASKAASDHLVRAWHRTYGLPTILTNCSNNYGPYQFPEKLIPLIILNALKGKKLPVYGNGAQVRDWLHVEDHARALVLVALSAEVGSTYNIGGLNEKRNIDVVRTVCSILDDIRPITDFQYEELIEFVADRPGHDQRYAIDASKIEQDLGWSPVETFESGLRKTVAWYLANQGWCRRVEDGEYKVQAPTSAV